MLVKSAILSKINKFDKSPDLHTFLHNVRRFAVSTQSIIEQASL
jgi:pantoate kinase